MARLRRILPDILIILLLFALPLGVFARQTIGDSTLLPAENLYQDAPFAAYREVVSAPDVPYNHLVSDLVLQNYQWKSFARQQIAEREVPLWNPHQFSGIPFLAAGQQSILYPLSIIYYTLPLTSAYGWFTVVNLWLAGVLMYLFMRGIGVGRAGGTLAGVIYQLCGFMLASVLFPMIIGTAVWLPLLLLMTEFVIQKKPLLRGHSTPIPWVTVGAVALGCAVLAGHVEITIYTLLITAFYAAVRLSWQLYRARDGRAFIQSGLWLLVMIVLGMGLASLQFLPLLEFVQTNWRAERSSLAQVLDYAHPMRDFLMFLMPNFYGSPTFHSYFDVFSMQTVTGFTNLAGQSINFIDWGMKNYVEGALYVGILPLLLAGYAVIRALFSRTIETHRRVSILLFTVLGIIALTFMFGMPTYALIYILPGINQLNSAFRWVFAVTVAVAVLAGFGLDMLLSLSAVGTQHGASDVRANSYSPLRWTRRYGYVLILVGVLILLAVVAGRLLFDQIAPTIERVVLGSAENVDSGMVKAREAFSDARMFFSFEVPNLLIFGVMTLLSGALVGWLGRDKPSQREVLGGSVFAIALVAVDLIIATGHFNPASDPLLLDFTPPSIEWLLDRQREEGPFRYAVLDDPTKPTRVMRANVGWRYGLDDIGGYESIIPKAYVDYMRDVAPQTQLDFNRIAPLYTTYGDIDFEYPTALESEKFDRLNVRYLITHVTTTLPEYLTTPPDLRSSPQWSLAFETAAVRIWRNNTAYPRAYGFYEKPGELVPVGGFTITADTGREKLIDVNVAMHEADWYYWTADENGVLTYTFSSDSDAVGVYRVRVSESDQMMGIAELIEDAVIDIQPPLTEKGSEHTITISNLAPNQPVEIHIEQTYPTTLVISENMMPGWRAYVRPVGGDEESETAYPVETYNDIFQSVRLTEPGQWTVRMVYSPTSVQVGLFGSLISVAILALMLGIWFWRIYVGVNTDDSSQTAKVARNSIAPIILNLFNRGIDFVFAIVMYRLLIPADIGIYNFAIVIFVWFDIFTNFGLDVFLMREVSRQKEESGHFFYNTSLLRVFLSFAGVPLLIGFLIFWGAIGAETIPAEGLIALAVLYMGLFPASLNKGMTSLFYAYERAEYPAAIATITTINKAIFGVIVLLLGYGIIGLAAVSIINNFITFAVLVYTGRHLIGKVRERKPDTRLMRGMIGESWPLMLNHFLATIFFQIDIVILQAVKGAVIVAQYSTAYKWLLSINIIPAFFTQALFPLMSRQWQEDKDALKRTYTFGIKLLVAIALPLAVGFTALAETLTLILGGARYLPDGAIALQIMIWSIPIGWMNSLTQYLLIAVDLQRMITRAFFLGVAFNIITNLIFIPQYSYPAAAVATIFSELVLLLPFAVLTQRALGIINWLDLIWRPVVATAAMAATIAAGWLIMPFIGLIAGSGVYVVVLLALKPLDATESERLLSMLPGRLRETRLVRAVLRV